MTAAQQTARADLLAVVSVAVREIVPDVDPALIRPDKHLRELGADSVDRVEIIGGVLEELELDEPLSSFSDLPDIDAMVDLLEKRLRERTP